MEDEAIIRLYHARNERAIDETDKKYGRYLSSIALGLLSGSEDAQECVNDTYLSAWRRMPPDTPKCLRIYLGRMVRNISVSLFRKNHAAKRFSEAQLLLSELEDTLPDSSGEGEASLREVTDAIAAWLRTQPKDDRALFVLRYWYMESVESLSAKTGMRREAVSQKLLKMRKKLRAALEKEEIYL